MAVIFTGIHLSDYFLIYLGNLVFLIGESRKGILANCREVLKIPEPDDLDNPSSTHTTCHPRTRSNEDYKSWHEGRGFGFAVR
jgi:hypothetical protein